jgi:hypothetical protein
MDLRSQQFASVVLSASALIVIHCVSFITAGYSMSVFEGGYLAGVCLLLPAASLVLAVALALALALAVALAVSRIWHWEQSALFAIIAWIVSCLQLLIIGEASAAV